MEYSKRRPGHHFATVAMLFGVPIAWLALRLLAVGLIVSRPLPRADSIVVLSGSAAYRERVAHAAMLYRQRVAPRVLITNDALLGGWLESIHRNGYSWEFAVQWLVADGVPASSIALVPPPFCDTYSELRAVREYAEAHHLGSLVLVTSAYHSRRALWTAGRLFQGHAITVGMDPARPGDQTPGPSTWWMSTRGWRWVVGEYLGLARYRWRY
jgi:uncharacterized SAM-binding protein YcdF (DUF218 family)